MNCLQSRRCSVKQLFKKMKSPKWEMLLQLFPQVVMRSPLRMIMTRKPSPLLKNRLQKISEPAIDIAIPSNGNEVIKISKNGSNGKYFSPLVRSIAQRRISQEILDSLNGSGLDGRVTKKDILAYVNGEVKAKRQAHQLQSSKKAISPNWHL